MESLAAAPRTPAFDARMTDPFSAFYDEHAAWLYRFVLRSGVPMGEVEDITQRVFLVAHQVFERGTEIENPRAFLRATALRVVAGYRRWRKVRELGRFFIAPPENKVETPEDSLAANQAQALVGEMLRQLPTKLAEVLILVDLEGLAPSEAATELMIPVNTVRSRRRLARESFAKLLQRHEERRAR